MPTVGEDGLWYKKKYDPAKHDSRFANVSKVREKWIVTIGAGTKNVVWLGPFESEQEAAEAFAAEMDRRVEEAVLRDNWQYCGWANSGR